MKKIADGEKNSDSKRGNLRLESTRESNEKKKTALATATLLSSFYELFKADASLQRFNRDFPKDFGFEGLVIHGTCWPLQNIVVIITSSSLNIDVLNKLNIRKLSSPRESEFSDDKMKIEALFQG